MRATLGILVVVTLAGACGERTIPRATAADLQNKVAEIRGFVENGQVYAARQRLERLAGLVNRLVDGEELQTDTALEILSAVDDVEAALALAPERSPEPEPTSPPPSPEEEEGGNGQGNDKDKDKGGGPGDEGHGNDD